MTTTPPDTPGRAFARYTGEDDTPVSLPGYLSADPGIVSPGDVFAYSDAYTGDLIGTRFEAVTADEFATLSPNVKLTKAALVEKLNADRPASDQLNAGDYTKAELITIADDYDRTHPQPAGSLADTGGTVLEPPAPDADTDEVTA